MSLDLSSSANSAEKNKEWIKKHPILTTLVVLFFIGAIGNAFGGSSPSQPTQETVTETPVTQPQTFEDRIKAIAVKTGVTNISFKGIEDVKADSNRPEGSHMFTISLNITDYYNADSLYRNTGELTAKLFQETFVSNPNAYDVIIWYYAEITDQYGNKENKVLISQGIDRPTYEKINWQNFDATKMCDFLKSEATRNGGETACNVLANIK